ncbi:MAG: DUF3352 domain-containing protein [Pyrinomonadaceae bacterium]|nr:DUF3352 domain-containing protein [Pyrinomonadaceae bacterium]
MPKLQSSKNLISLALALALLASPAIAIAQQKRPAPRKPAAQAPAPTPRPVPAPARTPTFDTLLAADSYRVYAEVRGVGQLIRSPAVTDLLEPMVKLGSPSKEFEGMLKWLNAQADALASSRMLVASWATKPNLPVFLLAIEFDSPEEAQKFDPKLRRFIPTLLPTPTPTPASTPALPGESSDGPAVVGPPATTPAPNSGPAVPPYVIKQSGSLILISDKPFAFKDVAPRGSKLLSEDQNFATARNRFASESIFVYIDTKSIQKEQEEQLKKYEEEYKQRELEAASRPTPEETPVDADLELTTLVAPVPVPEGTPQGELETSQPTPVPVQSTATLSGSDGSASSGMSEAMMFPFYSLLFGGESMWPEAVGVAVVFEGDAYVLRTLVINGPDNKANAIPFVPQFISGPALIPESPNIFPADSDLFVAFSVDYPQVYEGMMKSLAHADEMAKKFGGRVASLAPREPPFAAYEKKLGLKIKDDLLPLLGNEVALALLQLPKPSAAVAESSPGPGGPEDSGKKAPPPAPPDPSPVIAIAIKDRDAVRRLIPKIIESFGFKGAGLLAQTEKRDDTEITSYAGAFSYAFVGNFLVFSTDPAATRRTVDSFLDHQTLSSDSHFKNTIRWQPRQLLGQLYVAPDLVERYYPMAIAGAQGQDELRDFLYRLSPVLDPVSYALTNDGLGPLHELHVPRNMVMMMVAGMSKDTSESPLITNESTAKGVLRTVVNAQETFKSTRDDGRYGTLEELTAEGLFDKTWLQSHGYKLELTVSGNKFEATAVPVEYGKTGLLSYFIDDSGILRGGDHGGGNATIADNPIR